MQVNLYLGCSWNDGGETLSPYFLFEKGIEWAHQNYTITKLEILVVVCAFEKFRAYLLDSKVVVHVDHSTLKYFMTKKNAKARLILWLLLLYKFDFELKD